MIYMTPWQSLTPLRACARNIADADIARACPALCYACRRRLQTRPRETPPCGTTSDGRRRAWRGSCLHVIRQTCKHGRVKPRRAA